MKCTVFVFPFLKWEGFEWGWEDVVDSSYLGLLSITSVLFCTFVLLGTILAIIYLLNWFDHFTEVGLSREEEPYWFWGQKIK
jgi:hypothetical protein